LREAEGELQKDFKSSLGKIAYQVACHQRVQNIGPKTRDILEMIPETKVETIERCSGHDGTYAVKKETHENSMKIVKPIVKKVSSSEADHLTSDCPLAGEQIEHASEEEIENTHPISLLRKAYEI
jgi:Fe-S oxidoreductase